MRSVREIIATQGADAIRINGDCLDALPADATGLPTPPYAALTQAAWAAHRLPGDDTPAEVVTAKTGTAPAWCTTPKLAGRDPNPYVMSATGEGYLPPVFVLDSMVVYLYVYCGLPGANGGTSWPEGGTAPDAVACHGTGADNRQVAMPRRVRIVVEPYRGGPGPNGMAMLQTVLDAYPLPASYVEQPRLREVRA